MKTGSITYNGKNSLTDLGIYVTGSGSFDAAELDIDKYQVAGRNGDIIIPKNRYKNISVSYPAFIPKGFDGKVQSVRNWLRSAKTYARLEDTYDMDHFREALATGIQSFEPVNQNDAANFAVTFDCKPQRFLKTGETPLTIEPEAHSYSGEIVSFETVAVDDMTKAAVSLSPIQSLNGYDKPWAGGAGKNKFAYPYYDDRTTIANVGVTYNSDGSVKLNGTTNATFYLNFGANGHNDVTFPAGTYTVSGGIPNKMRIMVVKDGSYLTATDNTGKITITLDASAVIYFYGYATSGVTFNNETVYPQIESGSTVTTWTPYTNICPITGHDSATLNVTGKNLFSYNALTKEIYRANVQMMDTDPNALYLAGAQGNTDTLQLTVDSWANVYAATDLIFKTDTTVTFSCKLKNYTANCNGFVRLRYNSTKARSGSTTLQSFSFDDVGDYNIVLTGTVPAGNYVAIEFTPSSKSSQITLTQYDEVTDCQLEFGSVATSFKAPSLSSYPVTFTDQGTVYRGTFNWVTGKLIVTWKSVLGSALSWTWLTSGEGNLPVAFANTGDKAYGQANFLCSAYKVVDKFFRNLVSGETSGHETNSNIIVKNDAWTSKAEAEAGLADVQFVYELATPIEYTLTPAQVQTLLGLNNVWASDGTVQIEYADPFNVDNPTYFEARPLFEITNPAQNDMLNVNGKTITFLSSYTGTVTIDCETMDCFSGYTNLNYLISATDFPVLNEGVNIVTWSGSGTCTMKPRWWEL